MTEEDKKLISSFEGKLRHFMFLFEELKQENADLKHLLTQKDEEIKQLEWSRKELEARYTDLKMARTISLYDKDIKDTKQRLSSLVREVDKCIALLNE
jgi:predicted RNase H-like nuclease (RuvC/YqgF family)